MHRNNERYLIVEAKKKFLKKIQEYNQYNYNIIIVKNLPMDSRHNYKVDYNEIIKIIE